MTVTAPATSRLREASAARLSVSRPARRTMPASPNGTLMRKIQRHESSVGEDAAEQRAGGAAARGAALHDAERPARAARLGEGGGEDRERRGREHGGAEPLHRAGGDQRRGPGRRPPTQAREREQRRARR